MKHFTAIVSYFERGPAIIPKMSSTYLSLIKFIYIFRRSKLGIMNVTLKCNFKPGHTVKLEMFVDKLLMLANLLFLGI